LEQTILTSTLLSQREEMNLLGRKIGLFFLITFCVFTKVFSQSTCSFSLYNSDFEESNIDLLYGVQAGWITVDDNTVPGWLTTASDRQIEIWNNGMYSMNAYSGTQWVELNANEVAALYQDAVTVPGTTLNFGFAHRGRDGIDVMKLEVGPPGGPYTTIGNYSTDNSAWVYYTGTYLVPAGQTTTRFYFTSMSSSSGSNGMGNLLDAINIQGVNVTMELNTQTSCNRIDVVSVAPPGISLEYSLNGGAFQNDPFFANLNAGNYTVSMRIGGVCVREKTIFVPGPGILDLGADQTICINDPAITIAANAIFSSYLWDSGENTPSIKTNVAGKHKLTVATAFGCPSSDSINVIVNPLPVFDLGADKTYCAGAAPITFSAGAVFSFYNWDSGENTASINTTTFGKHKLTVTDANGCLASDSVNLIVGALPVFDLGADKTYCVGATPVAFSAGAVFSAYSWDSGENTAAINTTAFGKHKLTVTDANGCSASDSVNLIVGALPVFDLGIDQSICANGSKATFDVGAVFSKYLWDSGENTKTISTALAGKHKVTATDAVGCSASDSINLTVNPLPIFDLGIDQSICANGTKATFDVGAVFTKYLWNSGENTKTISTSIAGKHKVTVTDANTCSSSDSVNLIVNPLPVFDLGLDKNICDDGSSATFDVGALFTSYIWNSGENTKTITTSLSGKHKVTVTDANSCSSSDSINLTVNPLPVFDLGIDQSICANGTKATFDVGAVFTKYLWDSGENTKTIATAIAGKHKVTVSDVFGCSTSDSVSLALNALPTINIGPDLSVCENVLPMQFSIVVDAGNSVLWNNGNTTPSIALDRSGLYIVTVSNNNGCSKTDSLWLQVNPLPSLDMGPDLVLCETSLPMNLNAGAGMDKYKWSSGDSTQMKLIDTSGVYIVEVSKKGCVKKSSIKVFIEEMPLLGLDKKRTICDGVPISVYAKTNASKILWSTGDSTNEINISAAGDYDVTISNGLACVIHEKVTVRDEESPLPLLEDTAVNCFAKNTSLELNATTNAVNYFWSDSSSSAVNYVNQAGLYFVILISDKGCMSIDSIYVKELCAPSFFIPNAFTPNNDTKNDVFYVESTEELQDFELRIFNRWGEVIFKTNSIYEGWNGQLKSGQHAQEEVYVWLINYRYPTISGSRAGSMNGTVTLLR